ncbi:hypothetical protein STEG23_015421, partial [Scotinomys teguina]
YSTRYNLSLRKNLPRIVSTFWPMKERTVWIRTETWSRDCGENPDWTEAEAPSKQTIPAHGMGSRPVYGGFSFSRGMALCYRMK